VAAVAEDATISGSVSATDADAGETATLSYALVDPAHAPVGLTFHANGSYSFDASSYDSLGAGQQQQFTVAFTATDAQNATSTAANLVITITGTGDANKVTFNWQTPMESTGQGGDIFGPVATLALLGTDDGGVHTFTFADGSTSLAVANSGQGTGMEVFRIVGNALQTTSEIETLNNQVQIYSFAIKTSDAVPGSSADVGQQVTMYVGTNRATQNQGDTITSGTGDDVIYAGNSGGDTDKEFDLVNAGSGDDTVFGQNGVDRLFGQDGNDRLDGGSGNDLLNGGLGNDLLTGSAGSDIFQFTTAPNATSNFDTITDFQSGSDVIQLENNGAGLFNALSSTGPLLANQLDLIGDGVAATPNTRISYDSTTGMLSYDADGSGSGVSIQFAMLGTATHPNTVTASDFLVI
jgi:VCBS repeat-containing protein